jgi:bile acid-coenzyme A ligase
MTLYAMMSGWARSARETPDEPAVTIGDQPSVNWGELHRRSNQLARHYSDRGVVWGDLVTVSLPTSIDAVLAILAVIKLGATPSPISARLPEVELRGLLELAKPRIVVAEDGALPNDIATVGPARDLSGVDDSDLPDVISPSFKAPSSGGSTGRPKLIMSGSPALMDDGPNSGARSLKMPSDSTVLSAGPLYHNTATSVILAGLSLRNHVVLEERFDPELTLRLINRHRVTWTLLVPTMMTRIMRLPEATRTSYDLSSLDAVVHNAAPCPPELKRAWIDWIGPERVFENYTATEQSAATLVSGTEWLQRPGTVGRAVSGEFSIRDDDERACPPDEIGVIWMRRPAGTPPTFRYIGEANADRDDRWETVGDLGWVDEDGYLYIADRRTDLIISGGANIYPAEVEAAISAHPDVLECVVVGLADDDRGKIVHAIVHPATSSLDAEDLDHFVQARLTRYKCPRSYEFVDQPIRNDAGKVRRTALAGERDAAIPSLTAERARS